MMRIETNRSLHDTCHPERSRRVTCGRTNQTFAGNIHIVCIALLLLFITGCEKDFIVKEQSTMKGLVINSMFTDAWPITAYLSDSYSSSGTNNVHVLPNARVELYEDGVFKEVLTYVPSDSLNNSGQYLSQLIPQKGKKYRIKAIDPVYGVATAEDSIPLPAQLVSQQLVQYPDQSNHLNDATVRFTFQDDGSQENYYRINVWINEAVVQVSPLGDTTILNQWGALRPELNSTLPDTIRDNGWWLLFSDKGLNGSTKEVELKLRGVPPVNVLSAATIWVELHTVSKAHYEYHRTLEQYRQTNYNDEPVHVYSNVQNGYGIFAGADFQTMPIVVK